MAVFLENSIAKGVRVSLPAGVWLDGAQTLAPSAGEQSLWLTGFLGFHSPVNQQARLGRENRSILAGAGEQKPPKPVNHA